jgi:ABC-type sugar transport system ATPase subunit
MSLIVEHINKWFGQFQVIQDLSMEVEEGALFGFLGPNGAGKTTTMRMILDIFRPDSGRIARNGRPVSEVTRRNWGYLPEERGLYPKMEVEAQLVFLAGLCGLSRQEAGRSLDGYSSASGRCPCEPRCGNQTSHNQAAARKGASQVSGKCSAGIDKSQPRTVGSADPTGAKLPKIWDTPCEKDIL